MFKNLDSLQRDIFNKTLLTQNSEVEFENDLEKAKEYQYAYLAFCVEIGTKLRNMKL